MKKFLTAFILATTAIIAVAEPRTLNKPVVCDATQTVLKTVTKDFGETPVWLGASAGQRSQIMLTVNARTGSWTLIEFTTEIACILEVGENSSSRWGTLI